VFEIRNGTAHKSISPYAARLLDSAANCTEVLSRVFREMVWRLVKENSVHSEGWLRGPPSICGDFLADLRHVTVAVIDSNVTECLNIVACSQLRYLPRIVGVGDRRRSWPAVWIQNDGEADARMRQYPASKKRSVEEHSLYYRGKV
jgi:hypothetical protein